MKSNKINNKNNPNINNNRNIHEKVNNNVLVELEKTFILILSIISINNC